ncbi:LysM peptidoglycan-binding domain-containing protein [Marinospirillum perlucidum]|uniref:LysM peptidoglycan-binding domain-containing protein n=1 Tax=Marinospirillum perlucidum TaxID=1982602 RepID=UPI000DF4B17B|nr:LysM peptidoglycan-binding domain-containing protein [Marinospirillum perlucidum]
MPIQLKPLLSPLANSINRRLRPVLLVTSLGLLTSGCQNLIYDEATLAARQAEAERLERLEAEQQRLAKGSVIWSQLESGQQLSSYRFHDDHQGLSSLLPVNNQQNWRHWEAASLPEYDLWDRLRENFAMDISNQSSRVNAQLSWYRRHPGYMDRVTARASRYMFHVIEEIEKRGLPGELALLPIVESAYDPFAYSHGRASGMWQFIPGTARYFGLENNWWYDGRRDVMASTDAALTYLERLYRRFDDWHLALAAYNAGGGNVNRALRHNRRAGGSGSFWELSTLPIETRTYVPKLIALAQLFSDPQRHGIALNSIPNQPYFAAVDTQGQIDLAKAAELADISINELYLLNPGYSQWATSPTGPHRLLVPQENAAILEANLQRLPPRRRMSWQRYQVESGDSLLTISRQFNTTPSMIRDANQLRGDIIRAGSELLIPIPSQDASQYALSEQQRLERTQNVRRRGERVEHLVRSGDSFWELARTHNVSVRQLASWNNMAPGDPLMAGQRLVIWSRAENARSLANNASRSVIRRVTYRVRQGDNLARIANRFKVSIRDIGRWNNINPNNYLQPGQSLTLHVDVTRN